MLGISRWIGTIQATETLKLPLEIGKPLVGRLLLYNALDMEFRELIEEKSELPGVRREPDGNETD